MAPIEMWNEGVALLAGLIACGIDLKCRKIPNWLTLTAFGIGLGGHAVSGLGGGLNALGGGLTGLGLLILPFLTGGLGGGDVKLLMALGALLGTVRVFWVFVYAGIAGGVFSLLYLVYKFGISGTAWRLRLWLESLARRQRNATSVLSEGAPPLKIPYGVAILCGLVWEFIFRFG